MASSGQFWVSTVAARASSRQTDRDRGCHQFALDFPLSNGDSQWRPMGGASSFLFCLKTNSFERESCANPWSSVRNMGEAIAPDFANYPGIS